MMLSSAFDASSEGKELRSIWPRTAKDDCRSLTDLSFRFSISFATWMGYLVLPRPPSAGSLIEVRSNLHLIHVEVLENASSRQGSKTSLSSGLKKGIGRGDLILSEL